MTDPAAHYRGMKIQPWEAMAAWLRAEQLTGFYLGNVVKYLARFNVTAMGKGGLADLYKARDYLNRLIALEEEA